jgi:hypothetical protein
MNIHSGPFRAAALAVLAACASLCFAVETRVWEQAEQTDFTRGTLKNISVRSDGSVTLALRFKELDSTNIPYLWTIAQDSKGTIYYGGGAPTGAMAKVMALPLNGKPRTFAELTGLEVHALAVDAQDRVYAAVDPDAKIYRIDQSGKPQLFFDPHAKYVWAMAFDHAGNLFVATGDSGLIYRVAPNGKGSVFFNTGETHARSMIVDAEGNLIVGTEPSGLVIRVTPEGKGFVLYQTDKREVTAVAERDGVIYASAVGNKAGTVSVNGISPVLPSTPTPITATGTRQKGTRPPMLAPATGTLNASVSGGSDFYRIEKNGYADRMWSSPTELVYAIAFDAAGRPLLGTGNRGIIYRIDSAQLSTELLNAPPTQVTAFLQGKNNSVYAVTGNVGNVYEIGPALANSGTLESEAFDAGGFSYWGKIHLIADLHGGTIAVETRSGNTGNPENGWSGWSKVNVSVGGGQIESPPARFLQYRLAFACGSENSPELTAVDAAFLPKNVAPKVSEIEIAPYNYREQPGNTGERNEEPSGSPASLTLPPVGRKRGPSLATAIENSGLATLQYSKGYVTARWDASDANGDALIYKVEIKNQNDSFWRLLKDHLQDRYYSFDSDTLPDGRYTVRVTASDAPDNTPQTALTASLESDPLVIDNTPPVLTLDSTAKNGAARILKVTARDALSWVVKAEYSIDGGEWKLLQPVDKVSDSRVLTYDLEGTAGQMIAVRVFDENDNIGVKQFPLE